MNITAPEIITQFLQEFVLGSDVNPHLQDADQPLPLSPGQRTVRVLLYYGLVAELQLRADDETAVTVGDFARALNVWYLSHRFSVLDDDGKITEKSPLGDHVFLESLTKSARSGIDFEVFCGS